MLVHSVEQRLMLMLKPPPAVSLTCSLGTGSSLSTQPRCNVHIHAGSSCPCSLQHNRVCSSQASGNAAAEGRDPHAGAGGWVAGVILEHSGVGVEAHGAMVRHCALHSIRRNPEVRLLRPIMQVGCTVPECAA